MCFVFIFLRVRVCLRVTIILVNNRNVLFKAFYRVAKRTNDLLPRKFTTAKIFFYKFIHVVVFFFVFLAKNKFFFFSAESNFFFVKSRRKKNHWLAHLFFLMVANISNIFDSFFFPFFLFYIELLIQTRFLNVCCREQFFVFHRNVAPVAVEFIFLNFYFFNIFFVLMPASQ